MYVIVGGSGFLGRYLIKNILENTTDKIIATYSNEKPDFENERLIWQKVDIQLNTDLEQLNNLMSNDAKVIFLAAYHHPDKVEQNQSLAWNINIIALANALNILSKAKVFYYASTDSVYGEGSETLKFKEEDPCNPVNLYGKHKTLAEQLVLTKGYNVIRYPFIIGSSLVENKKHFFDNIIDDIKNEKIVEMFSDSYRSTLSFNQCADYLIEIIEKYGSCPEKTLNIASDFSMSKYDVAIKICDIFNLDKKFVKPISIDDCKQIFTAKRATTAVLDNSKLRKILQLNRIELEF